MDFSVDPPTKTPVSAVLQRISLEPLEDQAAAKPPQDPTITVCRITVREVTEHEARILERNGWARIGTKTLNMISTYVKP